MRTLLSLFYFSSILSFSQITDIRINLNQVSSYSENNLICRFYIPNGFKFIGWNKDCIIVENDYEFQTMTHCGESISKLNKANRELKQITMDFIIIKEDNNLNYYNVNFISRKKIVI